MASNALGWRDGIRDRDFGCPSLAVRFGSGQSLELELYTCIILKPYQTDMHILQDVETMMRWTLWKVGS